jgi:hypothetical protein
MAADAWTIYDTFARDVGTGLIDLDNDTFHLALFTVDSNASDIASVSQLSDITNELESGSGYNLEGCPLSDVTFTLDGPYSMLDASNVTFDADGGNLVFRRGVIFDKTATGCPVVCQTLFDNSPADITVTDGNTFSCCFSASGILSFIASAQA